VVIEDGQIKGSFKGFYNMDTFFEFHSGGKWRQKEYKYYYHYAYMPRAKIVDRNGRYYLEVDGMNDCVEVVRIR